LRNRDRHNGHGHSGTWPRCCCRVAAPAAGQASERDVGGCSIGKQEAAAQLARSLTDAVTRCSAEFRPAGKSGGLNVLMGNLTACTDAVIWVIGLKRGMELQS
jgi:hypothetical protein